MSVEMSGAAWTRFSEAMPGALILPPRTCGSIDEGVSIITCICPPVIDAENAVGAGTVIDHNVFIHGLRHFQRDDARHHIVDAAGHLRHYHADGACGIILLRDDAVSKRYRTAGGDQDKSIVTICF